MNPKIFSDMSELYGLDVQIGEMSRYHGILGDFEGSLLDLCPYKF